MSSIAASNPSLSNVLHFAGVKTSPPYSFANLYASSNLTAVPPSSGQINLGFFRGLSLNAVSGTSSAPLANTFFEIRANDLTSSPVSTWGVFSQATANNRPTWLSTGGYNNGKYVAFTGTPRTMSKATATTFNCGTNGGISFAMLVNITDTTATTAWVRLMQSHHSGGGGEAFVINRDSNTNGLMVQIYNSTGGTQVVRHTAPNQWVSGWKIIVFRYRQSDKSIRFWSSSPSTPDYSATGTASTMSNISINAGLLWLFSNNNNEFGIGQLGGFMVFDRPITDTEVTNIFSYYQANSATS